ncbi:MAG: aspartate/glutamate racemase family protein [Novipirellula sp. JB048]
MNRAMSSPLQANRRRDAVLGVLCWQQAGCPRGLQQLEMLTGNSTNADSYAYPVSFRRVPGANMESVVLSPDSRILQAMLDAAQELIDGGATAITTSCGFNAIFQEEMAAALDVPVFTSSLLQIPFIRAMLGASKEEIVVITASGSSLTDRHFECVGVHDMQGIQVLGLEDNRQWNKIFSAPEEAIDIEAFRSDLVQLACAASKQGSIGAFVLECTDLPPFAEEIRQATGLPVFDFISMANYVFHATNLSGLQS